MTPPELRDLMRSANGRRQALYEQLSREVKAIIPVLLDAGRINSSKGLQEIIFQLDAIDDELHKAYSVDPSSTLDALMLLMDSESKGGKP